MHASVNAVKLVSVKETSDSLLHMMQMFLLSDLERIPVE